MTDARKQHEKVVVAYTEGRNVLCIAAFDRPQAETAIGILEQEPSARLASADGMARAIQFWVSHKRRVADLVVGVNTRRGNVVDSVKTPLPGRAVTLLVHACRSQNGPGRELLISQLREFVAGKKPDNVLRPFLAIEFAKPLILPASAE